jgi:hypothetical protein
MPLEATINTMYPLARSPEENNVLQIKVFLVPPYPYKKGKTLRSRFNKVHNLNVNIFCSAESMLDS